MRTIDLSPFYRSSIGFDRIFGLLENATGLQPGHSAPQRSDEGKAVSELPWRRAVRPRIRLAVLA